MNRRDLPVNTASSGATALLLSASGDRAFAVNGSEIIRDNFRGVEITMRKREQEALSRCQPMAFNRLI
jgi:hypothetical protein